METREIYCSNGCGKLLGTVSKPEDVEWSENDWADKLSGFTWDHCAGTCYFLECNDPSHDQEKADYYASLEEGEE